jgi:phospholipase A1
MNPSSPSKNLKCRRCNDSPVTEFNEMKKTLLGLFIFFSIWLCTSAQAQDTIEVFVPAAGTVSAGSMASVWLTVLNQSDREVSWTFPAKIECRLVSSMPPLQSFLALRQPAEAGEVAIGAGAFVRREYLLLIPQELSGDVVVEFPRRGASRIILNLGAPVAADGTMKKENKVSLLQFLQQGGMDEPGRPYDPVQFFKEHVSGYEPMYLIAGPESPAAKFQISFKYQILNSYGWLAERAPPLKGFHLAYTQTSLWDFNGPSSPFYDTSYKPEILYLWDRVVGGKPMDWFRLDLQGGLQHESNGKGGVDSRGLNIAYVRPTFVFGHDDSLQLALQPRVWAYVIDTDRNNADIADYRGYGDLRAILGWKRGLQLSALGRIGDRGNHEALQLDLTYPLMRLLSNSFTIYLTAQYFTGYGESLLGYNGKTSGFRFGFSLYR